MNAENVIYLCAQFQPLQTCGHNSSPSRHIFIVTSHHDYNRDYICLETSSEREQNPFAWFDLSTFSDTTRHESMQ